LYTDFYNQIIGLNIRLSHANAALYPMNVHGWWQSSSNRVWFWFRLYM